MINPWSKTIIRSIIRFIVSSLSPLDFYDGLYFVLAIILKYLIID